jgi:hypothetical protein
MNNKKIIFGIILTLVLGVAGYLSFGTDSVEAETSPGTIPVEAVSTDNLTDATPRHQSILELKDN